MEILQFEDRAALRDWLEQHHDTHPGGWVRLATAGGRRRADRPGGPTLGTLRFEDLLEEGLCFGWSESTRQAETADSYLQRFTPRRRPGTQSPRNEALVRRLDDEGRMTAAGYAALRRSGQQMAGSLTDAVE